MIGCLGTPQQAQGSELQLAGWNKPVFKRLMMRFGFPELKPSVKETDVE